MHACISRICLCTRIIRVHTSLSAAHVLSSECMHACISECACVPLCKLRTAVFFASASCTLLFWWLVLNKCGFKSCYRILWVLIHGAVYIYMLFVLTRYNKCMTPCHCVRSCMYLCCVAFDCTPQRTFAVDIVCSASFGYGGPIVHFAHKQGWNGLCISCWLVTLLCEPVKSKEEKRLCKFHFSIGFLSFALFINKVYCSCNFFVNHMHVNAPKISGCTVSLFSKLKYMQN